MKKSNTLLIAPFLFLLGFQGVFQTTSWEFNGDTGPWDTKNYTNITSGSSYATIILSEDPNTVTGNGSNNSQMFSETAGMDSSMGDYIAITLQNNTENSRIQLNLNGAFINFDNLLKNSESSNFNTYYMYVGGHTNWNGTVDNVQFRFKEAKSSGAESLVGSVLIDRIEIVGTIERLNYTFDNVYFDEEFSGDKGVTYASPQTTSGQIELTIDAANQYPKFVAGDLFYVDATTYKYCDITLINNSPKNEVTFVADGTTKDFRNSSITTYNVNPQTISFDLTGALNWSGNFSNWFLQLRHRINGVLVTSTGTIIIQDIVFHNGATANRDEQNLSHVLEIYPNPVSDILSVNSSEPIDNITVYNILGEEQPVKFYNTNSLDVSVLRNGVYTIKVENKDHSVSIKRFVKKQ